MLLIFLHRTSQHTQSTFPTPPGTKTLFKVSAVAERFWPDHPEKMTNKKSDWKNSKNTFFILSEAEQADIGLSLRG